MFCDGSNCLLGFVVSVSSSVQGGVWGGGVLKIGFMRTPKISTLEGLSNSYVFRPWAPPVQSQVELHTYSIN